MIGGPKGDAAFGEPQGDWRSQRGGANNWKYLVRLKVIVGSKGGAVGGFW